MSRTCDRAEILAGAIALGEAGDEERNEYRAHLGACDRCLSSLSGERDIERTAAVVVAARDAETWEPVLPPPWVAQRQRRARVLRYSTSIGATAVAISVGLHFALAAGLGHFQPTPANPITINYDGTRVTLERPAKPPLQGARTAPGAHMYVQHNVVTLKAVASQSTAVNAQPKSVERTSTQTIAVAAVVHPRRDTIDSSNAVVPQTSFKPSASAQVAIAQTPQPMENQAESIAVMQPSAIRNAVPLGGESAINPQPPMIAYAEGAEGTTAFEVQIDDRGAPVKCTITKSSGYLTLDDAVCKAAMHAKYQPKLLNGHAVSGVYHDAFTFHTQEQ